jgi:hypothetical protein
MDVIGEPILLSEVGEIANLLNSSPFPRNAISEKSFYAAAGRGNDGIVDKIRGEMKRRFPEQAPILSNGDRAAIVAYAYLRVSVPFTIPFFENRKPLAFRDSSGAAHPVKAFGIRVEDDYAYYKLREQVELLYVGQLAKREDADQEGSGVAIGEFALDPDRHSAPYQVIIAKVPRQETLSKIWAYTGAKILAPNDSEWSIPRLECNDVVLAPNIALATSHHFQELEGSNRKLVNKDVNGLYIQTAIQSIRFSLNRSGAELGSEAKLMVSPIARNFIVDGPFLVVLRKRGGREPFFALWVENPEVLEAWPDR